MNEIAYVGLGSNLGDRRALLAEAVRRLGEVARVLRVSTIRETEPVGFVDQPPFLNAVAELQCSLGPAKLLKAMQRIEAEMGRERSLRPWRVGAPAPRRLGRSDPPELRSSDAPRLRYGPRTIDLDLLLYGTRRIKNERLVVPHPRMTERGFVLEPLAELSPRLVLPGTRRTARRLWELLGAMTHA